MKLTIGGVDYTFEFTIEASLSEDCVSKTTGIMCDIFEAQNNEDIRKVITSTTMDIPQTALSMFYAGLLEHHSDKIRSKDDAKKLVKLWFKENADNEDTNWFSLLNMMIDQMGKDGFFKVIGLEKMVEEMSKPEVEETKPAKKVSAKTTRR